MSYKYLVTYALANGGRGSCEAELKQPLKSGDKERIEKQLTKENKSQSVIQQITPLQ